MFVIAFSPYFFVISMRLTIYGITRHNGETYAADFVKLHQQKIYAILWFLVNTLYLPVMSTMMAGLDCTFTGTVPSQVGHILVVEFYVGGGDVLFQVGEGAGAGDRQHAG